MWDDVVGTQPPPTDEAVWLSVLLALVVVVVPTTWRWTRGAVTIAHEGAHAVAAVLTGRRLSGVRLHADSSGLTVSRGRPSGPGMVLTAAAGYPGPALVGLGAAALLAQHHALAVLWLSVLLLGVLLLWIRNFYGLYAVLLALGLVLVVSWWAEPRLQSLVAYAGTWFLLLAAPKAVVELHALRRRGRAPSSDADTLARLTHAPGLVWVGVFLLVDLAALALAARWLLPTVELPG